MTRPLGPRSLNVAANWTAVDDQIRASVPDLRRQIEASTGTMGDWIEGAADMLRQLLAEDFADLDPDVVRRVFVRALAMANTIRDRIQIADEARAQGMVQAVVTLALYGDPR